MDNEMTQEEFIAKITKAPLFTPIALPPQMLMAAEYNPRVTNDDRYQALKKSMQEDPDFMKLREIIVNVHPGREGVVLAGARRLLASQELEWDRIPAKLVNVPIEKEKAWNLKDNTHAGDWDPEKRKAVILDLHEVGYDMSSIGFGSQEIVDIMGPVSSTSIVNTKEDPENQGGTPRRGKVKVAAAAEIECPECHYKWSMAQKGEDPGTLDEE